jgi:hypothetical protein
MRRQAKPFIIELKRNRISPAQSSIWTMPVFSPSFEAARQLPVPAWPPEPGGSVARRSAPPRILPDLTIESRCVEEAPKMKRTRRTAGPAGPHKAQGNDTSTDRPKRQLPPAVTPDSAPTAPPDMSPAAEAPVAPAAESAALPASQGQRRAGRKNRREQALRAGERWKRRLPKVCR